MMEFLNGRYGDKFMTALHRAQGNGLAGLQEVLNKFRTHKTSEQILHEWAAAVALDGVIDDGGRFDDSWWNFRRHSRGGHGHKPKIGKDEKPYWIPTLDALINWDTPDAYESPGAPPNGSDYVRLRDSRGKYVPASKLKWISFDGETQHEPKPVEWTVDPSPAGHAGNPSLYSGAGDNFDRAIIRSVTIPAAPATLTADMQWDTEFGFDSGFVQISTDNGATWTSLGNADTVDELDAGADQVLVDNLPGFNGDSGGWRPETLRRLRLRRPDRAALVPVHDGHQHGRPRLVGRQRPAERHAPLRRRVAHRLAVGHAAQPGRDRRVHAAARRLHEGPQEDLARDA